jgi:HlyD family secretion protein
MTQQGLQDDFGMRRWLGFGFTLVFLVVTMIGGWGAMASIASAVIASGRIVVESNPKVVQHREGGIVGDILIQEGQRVAAGDLLVRLDGTEARASLAIITKQLTELGARSARLYAIAEGQASVEFPANIVARRAEPDIAAILRGEKNLFTAHQTMLIDERAQLRDRISAFETELANYGDRTDAANRELALMREEQAGLQTLYEKEVISLNRVNKGKRAIARLEGEIATVSAYVSDVRGRLTESHLAITRLEKEARTEALEDWRDLQAQRVQLDERRIAAQDNLDRLDIRSPQQGTVHELALHTIGAVVTPGETLMNIIPVGDALVIEGRVRPIDIDQVHMGQVARVRFPALNMRTTPEVFGKVVRVGADLSIEEYSEEAYFDVRIVLDENEREFVDSLGLVPGMPAEVFVQTGERSALSYLMQPLMDQINRAFRE